MSKTSFLRSITAATLATAVFASSSMLTFAAPGKSLMGELVVSGGNEVIVNGETASTGQTVFSSNTITTPANTSAIVRLGRQGQVELAPNSTLNLEFDESSISGTLLNGHVKVSGTAQVATNISTKTGAVVADSNQAKAFAVSFDGIKTKASSEAGNVTLNENGKTTKVSTKQQDNDNVNGNGFFAGQTFVYAVLFGVAAGTIIYIAARNSNEFSLSSSSVVVSPIR